MTHDLYPDGFRDADMPDILQNQAEDAVSWDRETEEIQKRVAELENNQPILMDALTDFANKNSPAFLALVKTAATQLYTNYDAYGPFNDLTAKQHTDGEAVGTSRVLADQPKTSLPIVTLRAANNVKSNLSRDELIAHIKEETFTPLQNTAYELHLTKPLLMGEIYERALSGILALEDSNEQSIVFDAGLEYINLGVALTHEILAEQYRIDKSDL